jgi:hypothetical protein
MAVSKSDTQVTWSSTDLDAAFKVVGASSNETSDAHTFASNAVAAMITVKANHGGTPASGDTVDFFLLYTTGDTDQSDDIDEYDTSGHSMHIATLDTNTDNPAIKTVEIPVSAKGFKVHAKNNDSNATITVSAEIYETVIS